MRLRRRRLQPKAAAAPNRGSGPGTAADGAPITTLMVSLLLRVQVPIRPVVVKPLPARVAPLKVALLTIGAFEV